MDGGRGPGAIGVGNAAATAGDVNGDGYSDVLVGATGYDGGQVDEGRAYLYLGSPAGLGSSPAWTAEANQANAGFGLAVKSAGDVNGDGFSDVIVGAPYYGNVEPAEGRAFVYLGSAAGLAFVPAWTAESNQQGSYFGQAVGSAGDVNGDGFSDVMVGAFLYENGQPDEGRAFVYFGGGGDGLDRIPRQARVDGAAPIALLGRSDSETGFHVQVTGRSPAGRDDVRLEWVVKPLGTPFGGADPESSPWIDTGAPTAQGSAASVSEPVTGLTEGTFYHWRTRFVSANPYFPRSPWLSLAGNAMTETKLRTAGCVDADGDGFGAPADPSCASLGLDCDGTDASVHPGAPEVNDGQDNQCVGDPGHGATDEIRGTVSLGPGGSVCWTDASSAASFEVARSTSPDFVPCEIILDAGSPGPCTTDPDTPPPGGIFYYLVRATAPYLGSWGQDSAGLERTPACGAIESTDQRNMTSLSYLSINPAQQLAQAIIVGTGGRLYGIEIAPVRLSLLPSDTLLLDIYTGPTLLATAALPAAGFGSGLPAPLDLEERGPGYIHLGQFEIDVVSGQPIRFVLRSGWSSDSCAGLFCAASGRPCTDDFHCFREGAAGTNNAGYPSGAASINGTTIPNLDLVFKTLVLH